VSQVSASEACHSSSEAGKGSRISLQDSDGGRLKVIVMWDWRM
jgi:hypothetical protein